MLNVEIYGYKDNDTRSRTAKILEEFRGYLQRNQSIIPSYASPVSRSRRRRRRLPSTR